MGACGSHGAAAAGLQGAAVCLTAGLGLLQASGCAPHGPRALVDHGLWLEDPGPFGADPELPACAPLSWFEEVLGEEGTLQVDCAECPRLVVGQESLEPIWPGDRIHVRLWHYELAGAQLEGAQEVRWAIALDGTVAVEGVVVVPEESGLVVTDWVADRRIPEGQPVHFLLEAAPTGARHSQPNLWNFIELSDNRDAEP